MKGFLGFPTKVVVKPFGCLLVNARLWSLTCWWLVWVRHVCFAAPLICVGWSLLCSCARASPSAILCLCKAGACQCLSFGLSGYPVPANPDPLMKSACCLHGFRWVSLPWCYPDFWCYPWQPLLYQGLRAPTRCMGEYHGIVVLLSHL